MSNAALIDASVAVKWVIPEEHSEQARALLDDARRLRRPLVGPPILASEVTNAIFQRMRRRDISQAEAQHALTAYLDFSVRLIELPALYRYAFKFARDHDMKSTYDGLYVALAAELETTLWTDDQGLLDSVGETFFVRWIGDYKAVGEAK
ncbi:MAG: type II toxin-antitoxin system VapC family toxin [Vicinamibacterales bacterium]